MQAFDSETYSKENRFLLLSVLPVEKGLGMSYTGMLGFVMGYGAVVPNEAFGSVNHLGYVWVETYQTSLV